MRLIRKKEALILFIGDALVLILSLILTLVIRYRAAESDVIYLHIAPFIVLFLVSFVVFFIMGMYEKHTTLFKKELSKIITKSQLVNSALAIALFYFIPSFVITPKVNLFIYVAVSSLIMIAWRTVITPRIIGTKNKDKVIIIGSGPEVGELLSELNQNNRFGMECVKSFDPKSSPIDVNVITNFVEENGVRAIILTSGDSQVDAMLPSLYKLLFKNVEFINLYDFYEEIFDREPVSIIDHSWFIANISTQSSLTYAFIKRTFDIVLSIVFGIISLILYPIVYIAIKIDDGGPLFITQKRVGQNGKIIDIPKFRSMTTNDNGNYVKGTSQAMGNHVTRVGKVIRFLRVDELPQLWSVIKGDQSLIGPRPELPSLVSIYEKEVPHYQVRHLIKPGLSGWAQVYHKQHPHHSVDTVETKNKLSYDLYYIKHRSAMLDLKIALRTIQILMSKVGV